MVEGAVPTRVPESQLRQYLNATYCARFAREGWVYDDGALSIDAQWSLVRGGSEACAAELGGAPKVFPCRAVLGQGTLDCGLLHFVRRSEVRAYLGQLPGGPRGVRCDDGTPPAELGVP